MTGVELEAVTGLSEVVRSSTDFAAGGTGLVGELASSSGGGLSLGRGTEKPRL